MRATIIVIGAIIFIGSQSVSAAISPAKSLFDLSLQELLDIEVSVASPKRESVIQTPAIVSRFSRVEMERMGISNLRQMFNFVPGVIVNEGLLGFASVQIRGVDEAFNQKVLFLLNGVPYHQPSHSLIPMEGVPWEAISHIEVIRGPGAVFHGTQASGGVFNVVTLDHKQSNSASVKIGRDGLKESSVFLAHEIGEEHAISIGAEYRKEDGDIVRYNQMFPEFGLVSDDVERFLNRKSAILSYKNSSLSAFFQAFADTTVGVNDGYTNANTLQPLIVSSKGELLHIQNTWEDEDSRLSVYADYNFYTFELRINNLFAENLDALGKKDGSGKDDNRWRVGLNYLDSINRDFDFALGLEHEKRSVGAYRLFMATDLANPLITLFPADSVYENSVYSQISYTIDNWRFFIGGRHTNNENNGSKFNPRYAAVYKIDEYQSLKAVYSSGFNSPNPTQTSVFLPGNTVGNIGLNAEVVQSFDVAYSFAKNDMLFVANVYRMEAEDFIIRRFSEDLNSVTFFNEGDYTRRGAELDFKLTTSLNNVFVNLAYQHDGNRQMLQDLDAFRLPRLTMSMGFSMRVSDNHNLGGELSYMGERNDLDPYTIVNFSYRLRLRNYELFMYLRNLFDADILNPDNTSQGSTLVAPGEQGRNVQLGVRFHF